MSLLFYCDMFEDEEIMRQLDEKVILVVIGALPKIRLQLRLSVSDQQTLTPTPQPPTHSHSFLLRINP